MCPVRKIIQGPLHQDTLSLTMRNCWRSEYAWKEKVIGFAISDLILANDGPIALISH